MNDKKKIKVLNLYSGLGGNRKLWTDCEVTAVEHDPKIAKIYKDFFPDDLVVVGDAHQYLLDHFKEFDFIWSSPPCPTHSRTNTFLHAQGCIRYPDMSLWQEIIFLKKWFKGKFCVENVISYYEPLIKPILIDRHYFWTNFQISKFASTRRPSKDNYKALEEYHGIKLKKKNLLLLRNCVYPPLGLHIFKEAFHKTTLF